MDELKLMQAQVEKLKTKQDIQRLEKQIQDLQRRMSEQKKAVPGPKSVAAQLKGVLPPPLLPGNVGDIKQVIWDFAFTFPYTRLLPGQAADAVLTITQEAGFVVTHMSQVVFWELGAGPLYSYSCYTPTFSLAQSTAPDLKYLLIDAQSSRTFHNAPEAIDNLGIGISRTHLPTPLFFLPTSTIVCRYQNDSATNSYVPFITLYGYRVRIDEAQKVLSTMTA